MAPKKKEVKKKIPSSVIVRAEGGENIGRDCAKIFQSQRGSWIAVVGKQSFIWEQTQES